MLFHTGSVQRLLKASVACGLVLLLGGGMVTEAEAAKIQSCKKVYRTFYVKGKKHKAIATTGGRSLGSSNTSCGFAKDYGSRKQAISEALAQCRRTSKKYGTPGKCRIIEAR